MTKRGLSSERLRVLQAGLAQLPALPPSLYADGANGEELATDEAAVWKRVLNYRLALHLRPKRILETHGGMGITTWLYQRASPSAQIVASSRWQSLAEPCESIDLLDIDPFGQPWDTLAHVRPFLKPDGVLMVTSGEALAVSRNLKKSQRFPTENCGRKMPKWVAEEYLPKLTELTGLEAKFFYAFPSSVRVILSNAELPSELFAGCPQWMWWLQNYAHNDPLPFPGIRGSHA